MRFLHRCAGVVALACLVATASSMPASAVPVGAEPSSNPGPVPGSLVVRWHQQDFGDSSLYRVTLGVGATHRVIASGRVRDVTTAVFRGLDPHLTYAVAVTSLNGASPRASGWVSARAAPVPTPSAVSARPGLDLVIVRWLPVSVASSYRLTRNGTGPTIVSARESCSHRSCVFVDRGRQPGVATSYTVSAQGPSHTLPTPGATFSAPSRPVSARPIAPQPRFTTIGRYHVHQRWVTLWRGDRALPTLLLVPDVSPSTPVPVMVFAHGWNNEPSGYLDFLTAIASSGIIVAAPTSPGMAAGYPLLPIAEADPTQVADLRSVLTQVLALNLGLALDRSAIIEAGQSRGALSVVTTAFNPSHLDARVRAFVSLSALDGSLDSARNSSFADDNSAPIFFAGSYSDEYGLWPDSQRLFNSASAPSGLLGIGRGESHLSPWQDSTGFHVAIWQAIVDFCRWVTAHDLAARQRLVSDTHLSGLDLTLT